jgi:molecular chaperone GrpE (heat shock protein)
MDVFEMGKKRRKYRERKRKRRLGRFITGLVKIYDKKHRAISHHASSNATIGTASEIMRFCFISSVYF